MAVFTHLETDTGSNVDISAATAVGAYTANADKLVMCDVSIDAVAGNGDYVMYVTRQIGGSGSAYKILPKTTMAAASGDTAISAQSGWITVRNKDVLTVYVDGLAGDTSTPDWTTRWYELAGVTAAAVADAVLDEATSGHTSAGSFSKAVTDILADTGTDGVVVASLANDSITAAALKADAVTEIQSGLALEATLTAIKGAGWTNETLAKIVADISNISAGSGATAQEVWEYATRVLTAGTNIDLSALATATDLATVDTVVGAIKAKTDLIPASPAEAGEYTAAIGAVKSVADDILVLLQDATPEDIAIAISIIDEKVDAIKAKSDLIPASPAEAGEYTAAIAAVKSVADDILVDTGTTLPATLATIAGYTDGIAGDVWSHATRTLTVPAVAAAATENGTTLTLYKDADINIEFTGLTIPTGAKKVVFTIKDNLDDADTASALQATYQLTAVPAETHTLNYINSATPPTLTNPVTFTVTTDSVEFDMTAAAAYYLPRYERGYLKWDLKLITATTVQILQQGLVQILGTSTRTVA